MTQPISKWRAMMLLARRTVAQTMGRMRGWVIWAVALLINGLLFNAFALGGQARFSETVLRDCMTLFFATTCLLSPLLCMRAFAEDHQQNTWSVLHRSPWPNGVLVMGKFLGIWAILLGWYVLSLYMPALIFANGRVTIGHIASGYLGLTLVSALSCAMGVYLSTLTRLPWMHALLHYAGVGLLLITSLLVRIVSTPYKPIFEALSLYETLFYPMSTGQLHSRGVVTLAFGTACFLILTKYQLDKQRPHHPTSSRKN